jgi:cobaltochelatase CobT
MKSIESFKNSTDATVRAIAKSSDVDISYASGMIPGVRMGSGTSLRIPQPSHNLDPNSVNIVRGTADAQGFYRSYHNTKMHQKIAPHAAQAKGMFDVFEHVRCEVKGGLALRGARNNMARVFEEKCKVLGYDRDEVDVPVEDALHLSLFYSLAGATPSPVVQKSLAKREEWLNDHIDVTCLEELKQSLDDQEKFAHVAQRYLRQWGLIEDSDGETEHSDNQATSDSEEDNESLDGEETSNGQESGSTDASDGDAGDGDSMGGMDDVPYDEGTSEAARGERSTDVDYKPDPHNPHGLYQIYTSAFDEIVDAAELADPIELTRLRSLLDKQLEGTRALVTRLANRLQRKIMAKQQRHWQFDLEEGKLDASRLARIVANPSVPLMFKQEVQADDRDTVVSILIDNSGSMRGRPIALAAMSADVIAQTLERCNVRVEILGFTTRAWKGGQARELWLASGRPDQPGRLNDLRHIIYKAADAPMRRARKNLGLMLKEGILKENIDGEALAWAYNRLARRSEARKILMVISDGAPVDDSTLSANKGNMLEDDLRHVIGWIERKSGIELTAIGIGHDVTRYYARAITLTDADKLAEALMSQLANLFEER